MTNNLFSCVVYETSFADDISQVARMLQKKSKERTANNCKNNNS